MVITHHDLLERIRDRENYSPCDRMMNALRSTKLNTMRLFARSACARRIAVRPMNGRALLGVSSGPDRTAGNGMPGQHGHAELVVEGGRALAVLQPQVIPPRR